VSCPLGNCWR